MLIYALVALGAFVLGFLAASLRRPYQPEQSQLPLVEPKPREQLAVPAHREPIPDDSIARSKLLTAMERSAAPLTSSSTVTSVPLPSEDLKGRIIGREGRNIRAFEETLGVDLLLDETPNVATISSFDPLRREVAKRVLTRLLADGKVHPLRIEEEAKRVESELEAEHLRVGREAAKRAATPDLPKEILRALGKARYRTSYGQSLLDHLVECAELARLLASELGFDADQAGTAALLHDIGKVLPPEWGEHHALAGMKFLQSQGLKEPILAAVGGHHREIPAEGPVPHLVIIADTLSSSRPGARRMWKESHAQRLADLESLALTFPGVERASAVHSGSELRLFVRPNEVDDLGAARLASEIAKQIEEKVNVVVIREVRVSEQSGR